MTVNIRHLVDIILAALFSPCRPCRSPGQELRSLLAEGDETGAALIIGGLKARRCVSSGHHQLGFVGKMKAPPIPKDSTGLGTRMLFQRRSLVHTASQTHVFLLRFLRKYIVDQVVASKYHQISAFLVTFPSNEVLENGGTHRIMIYIYIHIYIYDIDG